MEERNVSQAPVSMMRRELLRGATVLVGGAVLNGFAPRAGAAMAAATRPPTSDLLVELDGGFAGYALDVSDGGRAVLAGSVPTTPPMSAKSVGAPTVAPLQLVFTTGMSSAFYGWISGFLLGKAEARALALTQRNVRVARFTNASIIGVSVSPLDASNQSASWGTITATIGAQSVSVAEVTATPPQAEPIGPIWSANQFAFAIQGLESSTTRTTRIEGIGAKLVSGPKGPIIDVGNLRVTLEERAADPFLKWASDPSKDVVGKRAGVIHLMTRELAPIGSIDLINLGVARVAPTWSRGSAAVPMVAVDFYCDQMHFDLSKFGPA